MILYGLHDGNPDDVRYVGVTTRTLEDRLQDHLKEHRRADSHKARWIQKAGGVVQIVELDRADSEADLSWLERFWIFALRACGARLTNATAGGDGLFVPTAETRAKMSASQSRRRWSDERRRKHSQLLKGRPRPLGVDQARWDKATPEQRRDNMKNANEACRGRVVTEETRRKIGTANTGRNPSSDARAKMSAAHLERWDAKSPEERRAWGLKVSGHTDAERRERSRKMLAARYAGHVNRTPEEKREIRRMAAKKRYDAMTLDQTRELRSKHSQVAGTRRDIRPVGQDAGATTTNGRLDKGV